MEDNKDKPMIDPSRLDLSIGGGDTSTVEEGGKPVTKKSGGMSMEFDTDGTAKQTGIGEGPEGEAEKPEGDGDEAEGEEKAKPDDEVADKPITEPDPDAKPHEPLPDYTEETAAAYDERFLTTTDGSVELNREAIADEIRANMAKTEGATERPNEGTYKYLKEKLGIPRSLVDAAIEGEKALAEKITAAFHEVTGGPDIWARKLAWAGSTKDKDGKDVPGAYTKEQIAAYNEGMAAGGAKATDQIELMNARYATANPGGTTKTVEAKQIGVPQKRRDASPKATATGGANTVGGTGAKPYADSKEHRAAMAAIRDLPQGQQEAEHQKVRARLKVSQWWLKGQR